MSKKWAWVPTVTAFLALAILVKKGIEDRVDSDWQRAERLLKTDFLALEEAADSLQFLYEKFHQKDIADDSLAFRLLSEERLPTLEFSKFKRLFSVIEKEKRVVFAAVSGVGATTLTKKLAQFTASKPENLMTVACAPQFDLELHREFIGQNLNGKWQRGRLLDFWRAAEKRPNERFVLLLQDLDKINPETFFGPILWEKISDSKFRASLGGEKIEVPSNFFMISVTHLGEGSKTELSNEHFKRLGPQVVLEPSPEELVMYLQAKKKEEIEEAKTDEKSRGQLAALRDTANLQRFVYFFLKANRTLEEEHGPSFQLGWTSARKFFEPKDWSALRQLFISNANGLKPKSPVSEKNFEAIDYAIQTNGLEKGSNFFARWKDWLVERGFFTEFTMIGLTALVTGVGGWWIFRQRRKILAEFDHRVQTVMSAFEDQKQSAEDAFSTLEVIKKEIDQLVFERKLSHNEAVYFHSFIDDKSRRVEMARATGEMLARLIDIFLEDEELSEAEYQKLVQFLDSVKGRIPPSDWAAHRAEVEAIYQKFRSLA